MNELAIKSEQIAEFHVGTLFWRQTYKLFSDRMTVDVRYAFSGSSSSTYRLKDLTIFPIRGTTRGENLYMGLLLMFVGLGVIAWMYYVDGFDDRPVPSIFVAMAISGVIWSLFSLRLWHYAWFTSPTGVNMVCLWGLPKNREAFEVFVQTCLSGIESIQQNNGASDISS